MRAVRFLCFTLLLIAGFAGTAKAQPYNNTPGVYNDVKVGVVPAALPPGSLPDDLPKLGPDLYLGTLTVTQDGGGYTASFKGERSDGAKLNASATFNSSWAGFKLGALVVGTSLENDVIIGIDGANLLSANINGVGTVDGNIQRVIARFTVGPTLASFKALKAPGNLR